MAIYTSTHTQKEIDNGVDNAICYGTSSTGASTAQKSVTVSTGAFSLSAGSKIVVKFSNANTAGTPTLKVGTNAAKNIYNKGSQITTGDNKALIAGVCEFIYDGTQFHLIGNYIDTTYESKAASSGGTAVSLCTTGEKYTWDNKQSKVAAKGSTTKPVYTSGSGTFAECSTYAGGTKVTLNGTAKGASTASFYAPTSVGTSGQYLRSNGSGAPSWTSVLINSAEDAYACIRLLFGLGWGGYTVNEITNSQWQKALLDSENKVIAGIKTDGTFWTADLS